MSNTRKPKQQTRQARPPKRDHGQEIVIGYVHPGEMSAYFTQSLIGTLLYDRATTQRVTGILNEWSSANVSNARNKIVRSFLTEHQADWLLFIDSDMAWDVSAPEQLLAVADPVTAPIMGGLCFGSAEDRMFPTIYHLVESDEGPMTMRLNDFPEDTVFGCAATGAAFLMIHRDVLEKVAAQQFNAAFPWFQETQLGVNPVSEDITFCLRAAVVGAPTHVHTGVHIGHHKSHLLTHEKFRAQGVLPDVGAKTD